MCKQQWIRKTEGFMLLLAWLPGTAALGAEPGGGTGSGGGALEPWRYAAAVCRSVGGLLRPPEFVHYIYWNITGSGQGWFRAGQSRYGWDWLAARYDADGDGKITRQEFKGPARFFDRLDHNHDGVLTPADFDWTAGPQEELQALFSGQRPGMARPADRQAMFKRLQEMISMQLFDRIDADRDRRISPKEWQAWFTQAAKGKDYLTPDDLRDALAFSRPQEGQFRASGAAVRVLGLFKAETGSWFEGPRLGQMAPDFALKTPDAKQEVRLSSYRGKKPVVLIFGNYT